MDLFINKNPSNSTFQLRIVSNSISDNIIDIDIGYNKFTRIQELLTKDNIVSQIFNQTKYYYNDIYMLTKDNESFYIKKNIIDNEIIDNIYIINYTENNISSDLFSGINKYSEILTETIYEYNINNINIHLIKSQNINNDINYNCNIFIDSNVEYEQLYKLLNTYINNS